MTLPMPNGSSKKFNNNHFDAIVIGAGISGLSAAYHLKKSGCNVLLLEGSDHVGGVIRSIDADGFLIERGPNSLRGTHEFLDLVDDLNLAEDLITAPANAPAYVFFNRQLLPVPMGLSAFIKSKLLSTSGKLRLLREPFIGRRNETGEESLASFMRRRLGPEVLERLVAPFISGVYAGDPEQLSIQASFARLAEFEAGSGSIVKGAIRAARNKKAKTRQPQRSLRPYRLCSFRNGLQTLTTAMADDLGEQLLTGIQIQKISQISNLKFQIDFSDNSLTGDSLILATPAFTAANLLAEIAPELGDLLAEISYTKLAAVPLAYQKIHIDHSLDGFGFLAPRNQQLRILGSIWNSSLFENRTPEGWVLFNNFIGGETDPDAVNLSDDELIQIVHRDLSGVLKISGEPMRLPLTRWHRAIPQYNLGHAERVDKIESALKNHPGLWLTGNYLRGVALGDCIKRGKEIASEFQTRTLK